jgi:hypothetical protein
MAGLRKQYPVRAKAYKSVFVSSCSLIKVVRSSIARAWLVDMMKVEDEKVIIDKITYKIL